MRMEDGGITDDKVSARRPRGDRLFFRVHYMARVAGSMPTIVL